MSGIKVYHNDGHSPRHREVKLYSTVEEVESRRAEVLPTIATDAKDEVRLGTQRNAGLARNISSVSMGGGGGSGRAGMKRDVSTLSVGSGVVIQVQAAASSPSSTRRGSPRGSPSVDRRMTKNPSDVSLLSTSRSIMSGRSVASALGRRSRAGSRLGRHTGPTYELPPEIHHLVSELSTASSSDARSVASALVKLYRPLKEEKTRTALIQLQLDITVIDIVALFPSEPGLVEWCFRVLALLALDHEVQTRITREHGAVGFLLDLVIAEENAENLSLLEAALGCLHNLSANKENHPFFASRSATRVLLGMSVEQWAHEATLIRPAWAAVCNLPLGGDVFALVREKPTIFATVASILREQLEDCQTQIAGCRLISCLGSDSNTFVGSMVKAKLPSVLAKLMDRWENEVRVSVQGVMAIRALSVAKGASKAIVDLCVKIVMPRMHSYQSNPVIQVQAMRILRNLADDNKARAAISQERGLSLILWSLKAHAKNAELQVQGAKTLAALAIDEEDQRALGRERGVEVLLSAIRFHSDNREVIRYCSAALAQIALDIPENQDLVVNCDGIRTLVQAIKTFGSEDAQLMFEALRALCNVGIQVEHETRILERQAHLLIIEAMRSHPEDKNVFRLACQCVSNLTTLAEHVALFIRGGTLDFILNGLKEFGEGDEAVSQQALRALCNLAIGRDNQDLLGESDVVSVVGQALQDHPRNPAVHEYAFWVLVNLAFENKARKLDIAESPYLPYFLEGITYHSHEPQVIRPAVKTLALVAHFDECREPLLAANVLDVLLKPLKQHITDPVVVEFGTLALCYLTFAPNQQAYLARSGGLDYVLALFRHHMHSSRILEHASWLLSNLAFAPEINDLVPEEVVVLMVDALSRFGIQSGIQSKGLQALCNITVKPRLNLLVASPAGIKVVLGAMSVHTAHPNIQEHGLRTVCNLTVVHENKVPLTKAGVLGVIIGAMKRYASRRHQTTAHRPTLWQRFKRHVANAKIQEYACRCLANLATEKESLEALVELGAIENISIAMRMLADFQPVQEYGIRAICNIALHSSDITMAGTATRVIPVIVQAMKAHVLEPAICSFGARTLVHFAWDRDNVLTIAQGAGIPVLLRAILTHHHVPEVVRACCSAINNILITTPSLTTSILDHEGDDIMAALVEEYRDSQLAITNVASKVLYLLFPADGALSASQIFRAPTPTTPILRESVTAGDLDDLVKNAITSPCSPTISRSSTPMSTAQPSVQ